jgi:hypothetical protein
MDPQAAARRKQAKSLERRSEFYPQADEQGGLWLQAPMEQVARAEARISAEARALKAAGDERTMEQLMCDVALALLADGTLNGAPVARYEVQVITPLSVLEGSDEECGEIVGWGPISPTTARELAGQAGAFTQVTVDDTDGHVIAVNDPVRAEKLRTHGLAADQATDVEPTQEAEADEPAAARRTVAMLKAPGPVTVDPFLARILDAMRQQPDLRDLTSRGYRPSRRLARFLQARDRTCVFPGCRRRAGRADKDHRDPWPLGATSAGNMQCLCRHHHRAKHSGLLTVLREPDGTIVWTTRSGHAFHRPPQGY